MGNVIVWAPKLIAALVVLLLAYLIGKALSYVVRYGINKTSIGKRSLESGESFGHLLGRAVFRVVILISLPAVLGTLGLRSLISPMQKMAEGFLAFPPNLVGAALVFGIGWAVASVVKRTVTSVLQAAQAAG